MFNFFGRKTSEADPTPQDIAARMQQGENLLLLDVRQPDEYREGHVQGSQLLPLDQLALRLDELPRDRPIVAMCRSGNRSSVAAGILKRAGFANIANLKGGMLAWQKRGLPVEQGQ